MAGIAWRSGLDVARRLSVCHCPVVARATGARRYALVPELRGKPFRRLVARIASRVRGNVILRFGFCRKPVTGRMADCALGRRASEDSADVAGVAASPQVGTGQIEAGL